MPSIRSPYISTYLTISQVEHISRVLHQLLPNIGLIIAARGKVWSAHVRKVVIENLQCSRKELQQVIQEMPSTVPNLLKYCYEGRSLYEELGMVARGVEILLELPGYTFTPEDVAVVVSEKVNALLATE